MFRRAKFIWTPQQQVDTAVTFRSLLVHGPVRRDDGTNRWFLFRRAFELPDAADHARLRITADSRYILYVNGALIGRGPARATPAFMRVDSHDVGPALRGGANVIAVLVHVYGVDTAWYEVARDYAQAIFGDGGLYVEATVRCDGHAVDLRSDESWRVTECLAWRRNTPRSGWGQGFIEDHDARLMPERWTLPGFDDSDWDAARPLVRPAGDEDRAKGWGDIEPFRTLVPRDIPPLCEDEELLPARVAGMYDVLPSADLALDRRLYAEPLVPASEAVVENVDALLHDDDSAALVRTSGHRSACILLEFDTRHAGYPFIEIDAHGGESIEVGVAETVPGQYAAGGPALARIARESYLDCAHLFRYTARPGRQRFEKFDWTAVKYLQLVVRNAPAGLRIVRAGSRYTHYPVEHRGAFECSDGMLTRLWHVGRHTALQCTHDAWEDCPGREKRQWLGDGIVHYLIDAAAFGPSTQAIDRRFLIQATESQRPDGLLQMFAPGDHHHGGIIIPDFNLHWICAAHHYLLHTGDIEAIEAVLPATQRALAWFDRQSGPSGLLADIPEWHFIEWARVGRAGESFLINAMWVGALDAAASMADAVGYDRLRRRYRDRADAIRGRLCDRHFDTGRGVFVDSVDPASGARHPQVSQQANAVSIVFGIAPQAAWPGIVARITDGARLRRTAVPPVTFHADPFDADTDVVAANTYFSHFVYAALGRAGRFDLALDQMRAQYGPMLATGTETLWESFEPVASLCHAFSATPVYQLPAHVLGVMPLDPGFSRAAIAPQLGDLQWARGAYPTPSGAIEVDWSRAGRGGLDVHIIVPPGVEAAFEPPRGFDPAESRLLQTGEHRVVLAGAERRG